MQEPYNLRDAKLKKKPSPFAEPTPDKVKTGISLLLSPANNRSDESKTQDEEEVKLKRPYKKAVLADDGTMKQVRELASASSPPASAAGAVAAVAAAADEELAKRKVQILIKVNDQNINLNTYANKTPKQIIEKVVAAKIAPRQDGYYLRLTQGMQATALDMNTSIGQQQVRDGDKIIMCLT